MACRVFSDPAIFGGAQIIACGPDTRKKCRFCACRDAKALCDWPMVKPIPFEPYDAIGADDILAQPGGWRARILDVKKEENLVHVKATVLDLGRWEKAPWRKGKRFYPFDTGFWIGPGNLHKFRVERPSTCDKACCFRHRRHVGPDRDYCMDHWREEAP